MRQFTGNSQQPFILCSYILSDSLGIGVLYKFRDFPNLDDLNNCNTYKILKDKKLWFSRPEGFNDPYEGKFNWLENEDLYGHFDFSKILAGKVGSLMEMTNRGIGAFQANDDNEFLNLALLYSSALEYPSVRNEAKRWVKQNIENNIIQHSFVLCLFQNYSNISYWSHYAKHHTGIALGFKSGVYNNFTRRKVTYQTTYSQTDYFKTNLFQLIEDVLFTKSAHWLHEDELRIICFPLKEIEWKSKFDCLNLSLELKDFIAHTNEFLDKYKKRRKPNENDALQIEMAFWNTQFDAFKSALFDSEHFEQTEEKGVAIEFGSPEFLKEVIFGAKVKEEDLYKVRKIILDQGFTDTDFYQMKLDEKAYKLNRVPVR